MSHLSQQFLTLKKAIGGNRELMHYEETFGMPREEQQYITPPSPMLRRLLGELEFALRLNDSLDGKFDGDLEKALSALLAAQNENGALSQTDCL